MLETNPSRKVEWLRENNQRLRYLTPEEIEELYESCADHLTLTLRRQNFKSPYVFARDDGKPCIGIKTAFQNAVKRAKIKDFRFHDPIRIFASHLVMSGVDLMTVKELLGHKTITMTLRCAHLSASS
jgi:site-specific recombinase XerD